MILGYFLCEELQVCGVKMIQIADLVGSHWWTISPPYCGGGMTNNINQPPFISVRKFWLHDLHHWPLSYLSEPNWNGSLGSHMQNEDFVHESSHMHARL